MSPAIRRARRRWLAAVVLTATVLAGGCGNDSDDSGGEAASAFVDDYQQVTDDFERRTDQVRAQGREALGEGGDAVLDVYEQLLAASRDAHAAYVELEPVDDVRAAYEKLVEELGKQIDVLDAVVTAAEAGDDSELAVQLQELASVVVEVTTARRTLDRQIGSLAVS